MSVKITTLSNGLRVASEYLPGIETATLGLWVGVGSRFEKFNEHGISHFLEHMAFKGTHTRSAQDIAEAIENVGGHLNAYTSKESTAYHARVLGEHVPLAVEIIADIIQNSIMDPLEMDKERDVIIQEIGQAYDTPDDIIFEYFQQTAYPNQPMGHPILGTVESVSSFKPEDLKRYIAEHYRTGNMVFAATGKIDHNTLVTLCEKAFTHLNTEPASTFLPATYKGGSFEEKRALEQSHVVWGFPSVAYEDPRYYAASLYSNILGGGMSSRLFQEVREKRGLVYSIYSFLATFKDSGILGIYGGTHPNSMTELLPVVQEVIAKLPNTLTDVEIARSKAQLKAGLMMALESTSARCEQLANQLLVYGHTIHPQDILLKVDQVTGTDISSFGEDILKGPQTYTTIRPE